MNSAETGKILLLVDGHSILHRAYHAFPKSLITSNGRQTNAAYGFTRIILSVLNKFEPSFVAVSFDTAEPTFRHQEFAPYKEHRPEMDPELADQIPLVYEVVEALGIPIFEVAGYEADDVIGSLAEQANSTNERESESESKRIRETIIVTDDMDMLQLVGNGTRVYMPKKDKLWTRDKVKEEFGFPPEKIDDYKSLRGDPSDNIPGVRGIGPKTARKLLSEFDSMEEIYQNLEMVKSKRVRKLLAESAEQAVLSKQLATIVVDVPITLDLKKCRLGGYDPARAREVFSKLEFKSLLKMLPEENGGKQMDLL
ncbi:MAG: 5'-3' exonuclease H3TH domain-containing protein [Patescibacteria group bacterium]|nr:5'-3' exonuclease H3TH domain-containing protein [Patescibacteria group bacterium]